MKKNKNGFTLAELLIVVAIIAVLVAIAIPIFRKHVEKSKEAYDIATMRQAASLAVEFYYSGVKDATSAANAGFGWNKEGGADRHNAYGAYDPSSGKFYPDKKMIKAYGKGTKVDGGTKFIWENGREAYLSTEDYTDAVVMVAIYPEGSNQHIDVYWKKNRNGNNYIGNDDGPDNPKYSIRIQI